MVVICSFASVVALLTATSLAAVVDLNDAASALNSYYYQNDRGGHVQLTAMHWPGPLPPTPHNVSAALGGRNCDGTLGDESPPTPVSRLVAS